jgi:hypothetical protein
MKKYYFQLTVSELGTQEKNRILIEEFAAP